jgi:hypothetical protein
MKLDNNLPKRFKVKLTNNKYLNIQNIGILFCDTNLNFYLNELQKINLLDFWGNTIYGCCNNSSFTFFKYKRNQYITDGKTNNFTDYCIFSIDNNKFINLTNEIDVEFIEDIACGILVPLDI